MLFDHNQSGTDCGLYFGNDIFPFGAVHIVVDGNKADVISGKDEILKPPHVGILPAQPGQVFDNYSGYAVILHISHHLLEPRPLKAGP